MSFLIGLFIAITGFVPGVSKDNAELILASAGPSSSAMGWDLGSVHN